MGEAPSTFAPMPLGRRPDPFDDRGWLFKIKHDGFRALAYVQRTGTRLVSRNGHTFTRFPALCDELPRVLKADAAVGGRKWLSVRIKKAAR